MRSEIIVSLHSQYILGYLKNKISQSSNYFQLNRILLLYNCLLLCNYAIMMKKR